MKSILKLTTLACSLALAATSGWAQSNHTPPTPAQIAQHEVRRYTGILTLTSDQQTAALALFTTEATAVEPLHENEHTLRSTLQTAVTNDDLPTIASTATQLGQINGQIEAYRANAEAGLYKLLTAEQKTRYAALHEHGPDHMGFGGPIPVPVQ